jgi:hypothetical protein
LVFVRRGLRLKGGEQLRHEEGAKEATTGVEAWVESGGDRCDGGVKGIF